MGNKIEKKTYTNNSYDCAVYATQGYRRNMEDRHFVTLSLRNHSEYALFAVFDGFNGDYASQYLAQNLHSKLDNLDTLANDDLIISTVNAMDYEWLNSESKTDDFKQEIKSDKNAGSTIVFALIHCDKSEKEKECKIRIFYAGDSRAVAVLQNPQSFESLSVDHHCDLEGERERIRAAKGVIVNERVDGRVAITRCFGCAAMKNNASLPQNEQKMISTLECTHFVCKSGDILLLFCDGLVAGNWSNETLFGRFCHSFGQHKSEKNGLLNSLMYLSEEATEDGSKDNITVIGVRFENKENSAKNITNVQTNSDYLPSLSTGIYGTYLYKTENLYIAQWKRRLFETEFEKMLNSETLQLSDCEVQNISDFGHLLSEKHGFVPNIHYSHSDLVRYVIGCKQKLGVAEERFLNLKKLESEYNLNGIKVSEVCAELQKECYVLCGYDWENIKIIGFRISKFVKTEMNVAVIIKAIHCWIDAIALNMDILRDGIIILLDMNGVKKENLSLDLERIFIKSFQNCYPLRIKQFIIVDAGIIIRTVLKVAKLMLSKKLSERIVSVSSKANGGLWKLVGQQSLPKCLNGKYSSTMNAWQFVCSKVGVR